MYKRQGHEGVKACLNAGVNDIGGTLMNETITRAAGAAHGQETSPEEMEALIRSAGRNPRQRATNYGVVPEVQRQKSFGASVLTEPSYTSAKRYDRDKTKKEALVRPGLNSEETLSSAEII